MTEEEAIEFDHCIKTGDADTLRRAWENHCIVKRLVGEYRDLKIDGLEVMEQLFGLYPKDR